MRLYSVKQGNGILWITEKDYNNGDINPLFVPVAQTGLDNKNLLYVEIEEDIEDMGHKVIMDYLTNGNPCGDFKKSTIGADDAKKWWIVGYRAASAKNVITSINVNIIDNKVIVESINYTRLV